MSYYAPRGDLPLTPPEPSPAEVIRDMLHEAFERGKDAGRRKGQFDLDLIGVTWAREVGMPPEASTVWFAESIADQLAEVFDTGLLGPDLEVQIEHEWVMGAECGWDEVLSEA